jgi:hypothetical protein
MYSEPLSGLRWVLEGDMESRRLLLVVVLGAVAGVTQVSAAQDSSSKTWTSSSDQQDTNGNTNPARTRESHSESNGKVTDRQSTEILGPDGRYVPYRDTETETVKVNDTTVRTIQRTYGRGPDGARSLVQVKQEDTRTLPDGGEHVVRTFSSPDANGNLQVAQRELEDSKQVSANVRDTKTTLLTPDVNGGFTASLKTEERQTKASDGTVAYKKSTLLSDGNGSWQVSEVREGTRKIEAGQERSKDERVLRPDANGDLAVVERTVKRQAETAAGEKRETVDRYSMDVPGSSSDGSLHLVQRESTVERSNSTGGQRTTRQVEQVNPGAPTEGLHMTGQTIEIVQPDSNGVMRQTQTTIGIGSNGSPNAVFVDTGKTDNPAAIKVDTKTETKMEPKTDTKTPAKQP